jgi:hypothetical protein
MNEAQAHAHAGYCYVKLEDWTHERDHLRAALRLQGNEYTREGALRNALLATTYVRQDQPDLDKAIDLGNHAVQTLSGQVTSKRCVRHVRGLVDALCSLPRNVAGAPISVGRRRSSSRHLIPHRRAERHHAHSRPTFR